MGEVYAEGDWVVCLKCGSKFLLRPLEAKKQYQCSLCSEPGLRIYNPQQPHAIDGPVWPEER
jgi:DNA-directed RNA polymerase subunit RPC12/RpoP